jgi:hypothetical protein
MAQRTDKRADKDSRQGGRKRAPTGPIKRSSCIFIKDEDVVRAPKNGNQRRLYISETCKSRVDRRKIDIDTIKRIGRYEVPIELFQDVRVDVNTVVVPEGGELPSEEELAAMEAEERAEQEPTEPPADAAGELEAVLAAEAATATEGAPAGPDDVQAEVPEEPAELPAEDEETA